jgi:hypothetical protein
MLQFVNQNTLSDYLNNDWIDRDLHQLLQNSDRLFTSDKWLLNSPPKRCIFDLLYKDLIQTKECLRVLDVGGGLSCFACSKFRSIYYEVLDLFHHESDESLRSLQKSFTSVKFIHRDWQEFDFKDKYDLVIANDIFPNVDQRLDEFIEKFSPHTKEIRFSLTYYNQRRAYKVKRVDADEIFFIRPWNGEQVRSALEPWHKTFEESIIKELLYGTESVFENGRQVCTFFMKGTLADER